MIMLFQVFLLAQAYGGVERSIKLLVVAKFTVPHSTDNASEL